MRHWHSIWQASSLVFTASIGMRPVLKCLFLLLLCFAVHSMPVGGLTASVAIADDVAPEADAVPVKEPAEDSDGNLTQSIPFGHDRNVEQALNRSRELLAEQKWSELTAVLQEILDKSPKSLVRGARETYHRAANEVHFLLREAGQQTLEHYRRRVDQVASERLQLAIAEQDIGALQRVAEQYRYSTSGEAALDQLGLHYRQVGDAMSAAQVWRELILRHPQPEQQLRNRPELAARYLSTLHAFPEQEKQFWDQYGTLLEQLTLAGGQRFIRPQGRDSVESLPVEPLDLPLACVPQWQHKFEQGATALAEVQAGLNDLAEHGLYPLPTWYGCRANGLWIVSQPQGLAAIDAESGQQRWFRPHEWNSARAYTRDTPLDDPLQLRLLRLELLMRMHAEATFNHLTTDGQRLFQVVPTHPAGLFEAPLNDQGHAFPNQTMICLRATTGETVWTTDGGQFAPLYFAGPPALDGNRLYTLAETHVDQHLLLLAIRPEDGSVEQVVDLSEPVLGVDEDFRRTNRAGLIVPYRDLLLCATGAGALIAVDRFSLQFRWAYRFSRDDLPTREKAAHESRLGQLGYHNWRGWRESQLVFANASDGNQRQRELCLFVSPESDRLHALDLETGEVRWTRALPQAVKLIGPVDDSVHVLEDRHIRSLSMATGELKQSMSIPVPGGHGLLIGETYLFPETTGRLVSVDLMRHEFSYIAGESLTPPGGIAPPVTMLRWDQQVMMLSHTGVRRLQSLDQARSRVDETLQGVASRTDWVRLQRQAGQHASAVARLQTWLAETSSPDDQVSLLRELLSETVLEWAREAGCQAIPEAVRDDLLDQGIEFAQHWWQLDVQQALDRHDWPAALEASLALWATPLEEGWVIPPDRLCGARLDHWLQGQWLTALSEMDATTQLELTASALARLQQLVVDRNVDLTEVQDRVALLPWGQQWRVLTAPTWRDEASYARTELRLLAQLGSTTGELRDSTQIRLLELYQNRRDAMRWYQLLLNRRRERMNAEADPLADVLKRWEEKYAEAATDDPFPDWPNRTPLLTQKDRFSADIRFAPIATAAARGTLPERLNISLDWPGGQGLQLSNSQWGRPWLIRTPTSGRFLRTHVDLARGWGLGQQLVLQLGSEVFGMSPISVDGERRARILWPQHDEKVDSLGDRSEVMLSFYEHKPSGWIGFPPPSTQLIDEYEHYVGAVGPVNSGYFCLQQKGMLVACDSATGKELWRRHELPQLAECVGDERRILIWGRDSSAGQLLRVADGQEIQEVELPHPVESQRIVRGGFALYGTGQGFHDELAPDVESEISGANSETSSFTGARFEWWNLLDHQLVWALQRPAGTIPFAIDEEWFGLLQNDGQMELVELATGKVMSELRLELPGPVTRIGCSVGEQTLLIAVSGPMEDLRLRNASQLHDGYRREFVNGPLLCLHRQTGELLWMTDLENEVFALDQPADLPVFVLTSSRQPDADGSGNSSQALQSRIRIFNRRDGSLLYENDSLGSRWNFHAVYGNAERQQISIKTQSVLFELDYRDPDAAVASPDR
ncbi:MAG: PQQ-binding-like beta-propeller repeat protein [Planctomycetaceae bacterium]|nr:PQQ-binding-like beta-propeller repeat protein [Planctomycetaceae bacterium]